MSDAIMTLRGFYNFLDHTGDNLFANLTIPENDLLDKDTLIATILEKSDDMEVIYSNPYYVKDSIKYWSQRWHRTFDKWVTALQIKYDPLFNYDRYEEQTNKTVRDQDNNRTINQSDDSTTGDSGTLNRDTTGSSTDNTANNQTTTTSQTTTGQISAFNSADFQNDDKSVVSGNETITGSTSDNGSTSETVGETSTNNRTYKDSLTHTDKFADDETTDFTHNAHLRGNIGVTTSQQMLQEELDLASWSLYDHISDLFLRDYVIPVYG